MLYITQKENNCVYPFPQDHSGCPKFISRRNDQYHEVKEGMNKVELADEITDRALRLSRILNLRIAPRRRFLANGSVREFKVGVWYFRLVFYDPLYCSTRSGVKVLLVQRNVGFNYYNTSVGGRPVCLNKEEPDKNGDVLWVDQAVCEEKLLPFLRNYMVLQDMASIA